MKNKIIAKKWTKVVKENKEWLQESPTNRSVMAVSSDNNAIMLVRCIEPESITIHTFIRNDKKMYGWERGGLIVEPVVAKWTQIAQYDNKADLQKSIDDFFESEKHMKLYLEKEAQSRKMQSLLMEYLDTHLDARRRR